MTGSVTEVLSEGRDGQPIRALRGTRKLRTSSLGSSEAQRFFLAKPGGSGEVPQLGKELSGESEAIVESLKAGLSYFVVSEWRGVADCSGKNPQLRREAAPGAPKTG